jgi:hypothetical protein
MGKPPFTRIDGVAGNGAACGKTRAGLRTILNKKPLPTWV